MVKLKIDGKEIQTEAGRTVLEAALENDIYIPNLCYHPDLKPTGACRLCIVQVEGMRGFPTSCTLAVQDGMEVKTDSPELKDMRQDLMWLLLTEVPDDQLEKSTQFKKVVDYVGKKDPLPVYKPEPRRIPVELDDPMFIRDHDKCILCGRCYRACTEIRNVSAINVAGRGFESYITTPFNEPFPESDCRFCGACVEVCPTGALREKEPLPEDPVERRKRLLPCMNACPAGIDIPLFVHYISQERFQDAIAVVRESVPFPLSLGCVCPHPCEEACRRCDINDAISIRELKRYIADIDDGSWMEKMKIAPDTGKKVAIVGAGPAGLTAAWFLRKKGHAVTVFESMPQAGGMMRAGIPKYRLPDEKLDSEVKMITDIGVDIKLNTKVEDVPKLFEEGFDAVFLAIGAMKSTMMGIPGEDDPKVLEGVDILYDINFNRDKVDLGKEIAVVGGGNVAIDVVRNALRLGVEKAHMIYRRTREQMPADEEEIEYALEEGVEIHFLNNPVKITPKGDRLAVECVKMELGEPDSSGRRRPVPIEGSEHVIEVDRLVMAIGQKSIIPEKFGVELTKWNTIIADDQCLECSKKGVFAGGDVVTGPATVVEAVNQGQVAASNMDKFLGGDGKIKEDLAPHEELDPCLGCVENFAHLERAKTPVIPVEERFSKDMPEVEHSFDKDTAVKEASRCLKCMLRLNISPAPNPPAVKK